MICKPWKHLGGDQELAELLSVRINGLQYSTLQTILGILALISAANRFIRDPNIVCHKNAINANVSATVKAGGSVEFQWTTWPHDIGPVLTYVANCGGDCADVWYSLCLLVIGL